MKLHHLYQACELEKNCGFLLVISSKVPQSPDSLTTKPMDLSQRTDSTSFQLSARAVPDANFVVFGIFSPLPFVLSSLDRPAMDTTIGTEHTFVFRLAPKPTYKVWRNVKPTNDRLVTCKPKSLWVGDISSIPAANEEEGSRTVGPAMYIDDLLSHGHSGYSETFDNEPLCVTFERPDFANNPAARSKHYYFNVFAVEVFAVPRI